MEPPRLGESGNNIPNQPRNIYSGGPQYQPFSPEGPKRKSRSGLIIVLAFCGLGLGLVTCIGVATWMFSSQNSDKNFGGKFAEIREPIGSTMPTEIREAAKSATPVSNTETESIHKLLQELANTATGIEDVDEFATDDLIDVDRFTREVMRTGMSHGTVNALSRFVWKQQLAAVLEPPTLGYRSEIVDFKWLVPDREARVVVSSFETDGNSDLYVLAICKAADGRWKLFDWRDLLAPMSEVQYYATYAGLPDNLTSPIDEFSMEATAISENSTSSLEEKNQQIMSVYLSKRIRGALLPTAQHALGSWLTYLHGESQLAILTSQLDGDSFADAFVFKARLNMWQDRPDEVIYHLGQLNSRLGWHPVSGTMASEVAKTPEHKHLAAEWLMPSILLAPDQFRAVSHFYLMANRAQRGELIARLAALPKSQQRIIELVNTTKIAAPKFVAETIQIALENPAFGSGDASGYLAAIAELEEKNHLAALSQLAQLFDKPLFAELKQKEQLWELYSQATIQGDLFVEAQAAAPDKVEFARRVINEAMSMYGNVPWEKILGFIDSIPEHSPMLDEWEIINAKVQALRELDRVEEAFAYGLSIYKDRRNQVADEQSEGYYQSAQLLDELGAIAIETNKWSELLPEIDAETGYLLLTQNIYGQYDQLRELNEWYAQQPDSQSIWLKYYQSLLAYSVGDFESSDEVLRDAIKIGAEDQRFVDDDLPMSVRRYAPFEDGPFEWEYERLNRAERCGKLAEFVKRRATEEEFDAWLAEQFYYASFDRMSAEQLEELATLVESLGESSTESAGTVVQIRQYAAAARGEYRKAIQYCRAMPNSQYPGGRFYSAISLVLESRDLGLVPELRSFELSDYEEELECVESLLMNDSSTLIEALQSDSENYRVNYFLSDRYALELAVRMEDWPKVNAVQAIDLQNLQYDFNTAGTILFATPIEVVQAEFTRLLETSGEAKPLDVARFPDAIFCYEIQRDDCTFVIAGYNRHSNGSDLWDGSPFADAHRDCQSFIGFAVVKSPRKHGEAAKLRSLVSPLVNQFAQPPLGYHDADAQCLFYGDGWPARLESAIETGIDPTRPVESWLPYHVPPAAEDEETIEPKFTVVSIGVIREKIPVTVIGASEDTAASSDVAVGAVVDPDVEQRAILEASSMLLPLVPVKTIISFEDEDF